jgi:hypothetical protein
LKLNGYVGLRYAVLRLEFGQAFLYKGSVILPLLIVIQFG